MPTKMTKYVLRIILLDKFAAFKENVTSPARPMVCACLTFPEESVKLL
jgi:hypothetical protein